jgi:hypothetical protein
MRNRVSTKIIASLFFILAFQFLPACSRIGKPVGFQLWSGNITLPPEYQTEQVIRGKIQPDSIAIDFSERKGKNEVKRKLELTGEEYKKAIDMIRNTSLEKKEIRMGGSSFDVTLTDETGKNEMGLPSNAGEWREFSRKIEQMASTE